MEMDKPEVSYELRTLDCSTKQSYKQDYVCHSVGQQKELHYPQVSDDTKLIEELYM